MPDTHLSLEQLRDLIGRRINYQGLGCQIIEVLGDGPSVVLQECTAHTVIQDDQYGEGHRRVAPTFSIPLWALTPARLIRCWPNYTYSRGPRQRKRG